MSGPLVSIGDVFQVRCEREEVRPVSVATDAPTQRLRAFKHRLDPNASQLELLGQYAGAARVAFNMLTAHNRAALQAGWDRAAGR